MSKILIVDDELEIAKLLLEFLKKHGYEVIITHDGRKGLEFLKQDDSIELIVLDKRMPIMQGTEFLRQMKLLGKKPQVIILTGSIADEEQEREIMELGYNKEDILTKPIDLRILLEMIKNKLARQ